jgi:hypothetical protein
LTAAVRALLQTWAKQTRFAPSAFKPVQQVFAHPDPVHQHSLAQLQVQGYLECHSPTSPSYRLSSAGWALLGVVQLDLRNL